MDDAFRLYNGISRSRPRGVGWLVITETASNPPTDRMRRLLAGAMLRTTAIKAFAAAHEGSGFQAAATRAVAASFSHNSKITFPRRIFSTSDEAVRWLATELPLRGAEPFEAEGLIQGLSSLRRRISG